MLEWLFGKKRNNSDEEIKKGFDSVKTDMNAVGEWIKHLNVADKQLFGELKSLKSDLSTIRGELAELRESLGEGVGESENKQVFEKRGVLNKQTAVYADEKAVQTAVQTGSFHDIFNGMSAQERLVIFTIMNSDMKLSYEDLALLLGKEKSTVRGQINAIKQKSEGLILEISEKNGKKRVYVPANIKEKLSKYAKVRVGKSKKSKGKSNYE